MKILMISIDKGLLGKNQLGDVVKRHIGYGEKIGLIDIIVLSKKGNNSFKLSDKVISYPTNSRNKINYFFDAFSQGKRLFEKNNYDLVVVQEPFISGLVGVFLKKKFKTKLLIHFHGDFWGNQEWLKEKFINRFFLWLSKYTIKQADGIRVMSQGQKDKLVRAGIKENKIRVISTPVDLQKYLAISNMSLAISNAVLHVGRDDEVKDYDTLIKAFKIVKSKFPNAVFWQAGADKKIRQTMVENNFSEVELKGLISAQDLVDIYNQAAIIVLSSRSESFGKVLVEANVCAKPVVATATTGATEIVEDGYNGFLVNVGDYKALAEKIIYLLDNESEAKKMGERGREKMVKMFSDNTEKIIQFWQDIIRGL